ncbi:MAG: DUF3137 domain-containing protein [Acidobacteria bacterium]|nr:DUF3137 domain-containing protein [Acidobacteriota bacterium]
MARSRIDAFYDTTLRPKLDALDASRRQVRWLIVKASLVILAPVVYLVAGDLLDSILPFRSSGATVAAGWVWLIGALLFALFRYLVPGVAAFANYRIRFKKEIVPEVFREVCPSAVYEPLQGITQEVFDAPGLFNTRGSYSSDDRVRGRIGRTLFEVSEVGRAYSTGSGKNSRSYVVFRGLFFHLDLSRQLNGVTLIAPEKAASHQIGDRDGFELVTIEHPAFEQEFTIHTSDESEARVLLTPALTEALLAVRQQAKQPIFLAFKGRRAYVAVHYGRTLFEPGVAKATSRDTVREMAGHFALVELVIRELERHASTGALEPDESLLQGRDVDVHALSKLAASKPGTLTSSDLWTVASAEIDDSSADGAAPMPRPEGTRIRLDRGPGSLSVTYGLRLGFWVMLAISMGGALLAASALRAPDAPEWAGPASAWVRATLPPVPPLDAFAADAPTPWLIVGSVVALLLAWVWTSYVRRVNIDGDRIRIYRGLRPVPRVYRRPLYGRVLRLKGAVYITRAGDHLSLVNPTASPMLTEAEAQWVTSEMKRTLGQA